MRLERSARRVTAFTALALSVLAGCAKETLKPVVPVEGKVLHRGKPVAGAVVFLVPAADGAADDAVRPRGVTGPDGTFRLTTYAQDDGAPPADYAVSVRCPPPQSASDGPLGVGPPRDMFRGRYSNPRTSGLQVSITPDTTQLRPFDLK